MNNQNGNHVRNFFLALSPLAVLLLIQYGVSVFTAEWLMVLGFSFSGKAELTDVYQWIFSMAGREKYQFILQLIYAIIAVFVMVFWYRSFKKKEERILITGSDVRETFQNARDSFRGYSPFVVLGILMASTGLQVAMQYLAQGISLRFPKWLSLYTELVENARMRDNYITNIIFIIFALLVPVAEEIAFRGLSYGYLRRNSSFWVTNITQALFFALFQLNPMQALISFVAGLLFGYVYGKCSNIFVPILMHIIYAISSIITSTINSMQLDARIYFAVLLVSFLVLYFGIKLILWSVPHVYGDTGDDTIKR